MSTVETAPHTDHSDHDHSHDQAAGWQAYLPAVISSILLLSGLALEHFFLAPFFKAPVDIIWYSLAFLPVGWPVLKEAFHNLLKWQIFTEFFLMSIATIGAFYIGEYPEGVTVMLFYAIGELFQSAAVSKAKGNIQELLDVRPKVATVFRNNNYATINPEEVIVGEKIQIRVGEKVPLDGKLLSKQASLNRAALTGESKPATLLTGESVLAGSINLGGVIEVEVDKLFNNSSIARILELVQNATSRKSETELLIRRLAKIYTPIVVGLAVLILILPYFIVA
ncbi:MAG: Cd2+/Zn2+-exporting ATPase, partial [Patescibacteria group bacterium]